MNEHLVRVTSVRSRGMSGLGGCIFSGRPIDAGGAVRDAGANIVVKASGTVLDGAAVQPGQWWRVHGTESQRAVEVNGYRLTETQIDASMALMERPSGEHIISSLAENPSFVGIGYVKARKLWEAFGEELYGILDGADVERLTQVLSPEAASQLIEAWVTQGDTKTLQWLQAQGFDIKLGRKVTRFFGRETAEKIAEDPYRLLSFCASWSSVDHLARQHFGVAADDPRRMQGAIEEGCYRTFSLGHTTVLTSQLMNQLRGVLGTQTSAFPWHNLVLKALDQGLTNGSYVVGPHGVQPLGAYVMERQVAQAVASRISSAKAEPLLDQDFVEAIVSAYETEEGLSLNTEQRAAVNAVMAHPLMLVTGGAGVGKTTVLKAMYRAFDEAGLQIFQLALAGRAAKRMQEATGRPANTIAAYLNSDRAPLGVKDVVVVDEASMVDIITMSRLCESIGPGPRMVLAGDPAQLMPVGPGLVLHSLVQVLEIPRVHLRTVKRHVGQIAAAANAVRNCQWPALPDDSSAPIAFIPVEKGGDLISVVVELYRRDPDNTQILCSVRNSHDGTKQLNAACQELSRSSETPVRSWSHQHGAFAQTGLRLRDRVVCTRNLWERGLQNGSLGVVVKVEPEPLASIGEDGELRSYPLAWIEWDAGPSRPGVADRLDDVELGYAITVHKAQGSQWPCVIVPITGRRMLDRTLVYTAVTRAQSQVILVGDEQAARTAVEGLPRAAFRQVALDLLVRQAFVIA